MTEPRSISTARRTRRTSAALGLGAVGLMMAGIASVGLTPAYAAEATVNLGTVSSYSVLAGSTVTNTGPSVLGANLGLAPGSSITGFPPGLAQGETHISDAVANTAQSDLVTAYNDAAGRSTTSSVAADLAGQTLPSGVYTGPTLGLTGTVTLDAQGDPNAVFIFQSASTLITGSSSSVALINGASPCNVFWQVGSSATLGTGTQFAGTVMALTSATLNTGANVTGRILARNGAVTLDTNTITAPNCTPQVTPTAAPPLPATSPTSTTSPTRSPGKATPTTVPSGTSSTTSSTTPSTSTSTSTPTVPVGNPSTGLGGASQPGSSSTVLFILAGLAAVGAVAVPTLTNRLSRRR